MTDAASATRSDEWITTSDTNPKRNARINPELLIPFLLFIVSFTINLVHVDITPFHPDETRWINRAHYLTDLSDPFGPTWEDQYLIRGQPPLGSYLMGLGLIVQGRDTETNAVWDFTYGRQWNAINGAIPVDADLEAARRTNAFVGAVTVVLVFFIANALAGRVAATGAGLLLALHPLHIWIASQALSDQLLVMLVALAVLAVIRLGEKPTRDRALLLGILLGLGGATKLSPMLLAFPLAIYGIALVLLARFGYVHRRKAARLGPLLVIQPVIAIGTFIISYPYLWPAPIERTWNLFELRSEEMANQSAAWPNVAIDHPGIALLRIYERLTWQFSTTGNLSEGALGWLGVTTDVWGIEIPLALVGIGVLTWLTIRRGLTSSTALAAFLLAGQVGAIVVGMQVDFYRYHLPIVFAVVILGGLAIQLIWQGLVAINAWRVWNLIPGVSVAPAKSSNTASSPRPEQLAQHDTDSGKTTHRANPTGGR